MPSFLQPDIQQIISQAVGFLLLLWVMRRFAWRPLLGVLDARRDKIEQELRQIEDTKAELARLQEDYTKRLAKIEDEARTKIQQAIIEGRRIGLEIQEQARTQARSIVAKAQETVELEIAKAKVILRDQLAEMTTQAVSRILQQKLDESTDRHLVVAALDELEQQARA